MAERFVKDGQVGVLLTKDYGAGWSTWTRNQQLAQEILFDVELVQKVLELEALTDELSYTAARYLESEKPEEQHLIAKIKQLNTAMANYVEEKYKGEVYAGAIANLCVEWLKPRQAFTLDVHDGRESIHYVSDDVYVA